jgi:hypothetical protein
MRCKHGGDQVSGAAADKKRLLRVTAGNLRQNHLYVSGHYDFFPVDCFGPSKRSEKTVNGEIEVVLDGLNESIRTDIPRDQKTGKPRNFFRGRTWVRRFYEHHGVQSGDVLALERLGKKKYRLTLNREAIQSTPSAHVCEFFAGIGFDISHPIELR